MVTLENIFSHWITEKYLQRSGIYHAITVAETAFSLARERDLNEEIAAKAALLHDIGHYEWYTDGKWNYDEYRKHDIHAIKGAERAHKLLIRLGEDRETAKEVSLCVLLHTDSYLPFALGSQRSPLQNAVWEADTLNEEEHGRHHYRNMERKEAVRRLQKLDEQIFPVENPHAGSV
ncbi:MULTISPECIES: HD domain-containing protein [Salimicrobium]|uniref:Phosphohydrolase n=2 Tax=Salimicrobium TaxID=351195 RepID=K2G9M4_9BACI|nr:MULTISPECIES: HD domain-containing protein [Salimicrobium]AKG04729.1 phosphohydrolase [Salimicrobium jeotgali]EKE31768.1 metal dependent phosphohydrolase [Salimicrobium jeotgali]MBM7696270.1 uncharacterized protein [Salimicrobium jeotgali]SDX36573.1 uncharacterized protein SAMN04488081_0297 [Salimicrobium album]